MEKKWGFFPWPAYLLAEVDGVIFDFFIAEFGKDNYADSKEKLEHGMLDAIACKCQKGWGVFQYFNNGIPLFFSFVPGFLGKTPRHLPFCILYSPLTSPPRFVRLYRDGP